MAGSAVQVAPSMPSLTWLYFGQASTVVTSSRKASRAAAGSGSRMTSCSKLIALLPQSRVSNQDGGVATTVTAVRHSAGSTVDPAGSPHVRWPEVIRGCTPGSAAGTSVASSSGVTKRGAAVVGSKTASAPGGPIDTEGDGVLGVVGEGTVTVVEGAGSVTTGSHGWDTSAVTRASASRANSNHHQPRRGRGGVPPCGPPPVPGSTGCGALPDTTAPSAHRRPRSSGCCSEAKPPRSRE